MDKGKGKAGERNVRNVKGNNINNSNYNNDNSNKGNNTNINNYNYNNYYNNDNNNNNNNNNNNDSNNNDNCNSIITRFLSGDYMCISRKAGRNQSGKGRTKRGGDREGVEKL